MRNLLEYNTNVYNTSICLS